MLQLMQREPKHACSWRCVLCGTAWAWASGAGLCAYGHSDLYVLCVSAVCGAARA